MKQTSLSGPRKAVKHSSAGARLWAVPEQAFRSGEGSQTGQTAGPKPKLFCPDPFMPTGLGHPVWGPKLPLFTAPALVTLRVPEDVRS